VSVKFKGYRGAFVTSLGLLKLPKTGTTTVHATASAKNKHQLAADRSEYLKEKKAKKKAKWEATEKEGEKEKVKWGKFSAKAFGKKGFVKKSIFKTPDAVEGKVGVGTMGTGGSKMTEFTDAPKYRKGQ
jgi:survival-of-motor-neuron-related-splicing factor 30